MYRRTSSRSTRNRGTREPSSNARIPSRYSAPDRSSIPHSSNSCDNRCTDALEIPVRRDSSDSDRSSSSISNASRISRALPSTLFAPAPRPSPYGRWRGTSMSVPFDEQHGPDQDLDQPTHLLQVDQVHPGGEVDRLPGRRREYLRHPDP